MIACFPPLNLSFGSGRAPRAAVEGSFAANATGSTGTLRGSGEGSELVLEGFVGGAAAEAAPWRPVEHGGQTLQLVIGEFGQVAITGQKLADPTVRVLDRTFCQGLWGSQREGFGAGCPCKESVGDEPAAAVEGDGPAAPFRQPLPGLADRPDQGVGLPVRVGQ